MMSKNPKQFPATPVIVLTGGGSGGHTTPILSLGHTLKDKNPNCNIVYIGHKGDKFDNLKQRFADFDFVAFVNGGKFRRYHGESFWKQITDFKTIFFNIRDFFRVIGAIGKAWRILGRVKPNVVFSRGSFVAVPVGIAAKLRGIPVVIHESDAKLSLANKINSRWAVMLATGMPVQFDGYPKDKTVFTGIPIDERIKPASQQTVEQFKKQLGINPGGLVLLISGGGLGSREVNDRILQIAPDLLKEFPKLSILHQAGQKNVASVTQKYHSQLKVHDIHRVKVFGFTNELYKYIAAADLVVGRAGASSIAEFAAAHKACILIPSPFLAGGHQLKNAQALQKIGAVEVAGEDISGNELRYKIAELLESPKQRQVLAAKLGSTARLDASAKLAEILLNVAKQK